MERPSEELNLTAELRALRPVPRTEFAADLDARVAGGFQRGEAGLSVFGRLAAVLRATPPRRLLATGGGLALAAVVVATAILISSEDKPAPIAIDNGPAVTHSQRLDELVTPSKGSVGHNSSGVQHSGAVPESDVAQALSGHAAGAAEQLRRMPTARYRNVERGAQIVLGAEAADVRDDAAKVFDAVHAADGIVLRSSIRDGASGDAGASFALLIPSRNLSDALAAFSAIGEVRSRREATADITAPTVTARERLKEARASVASLLAQLSAAETESEREAIEIELRGERRHAAGLRSQLSKLHRRADFSQVSLRIETGESGTSSGGAWGIDDGLDDAGRVLAVAAGVTVVGLAILTPLALVCLLAWLAHRAWLQARRKQALSRRV